MIAGLVFNCGGCRVRLQAISEGREEFAAQLEEARRNSGSLTFALHNPRLEAWAVLPDARNRVVCPQCGHRTVLVPRSGTDK
jgi:hypothetical protein